MSRGLSTARKASFGAGIGLLAICFAVLLFNSGSRFAIGLLLKPMADEFGSERTALAFAVTLFMTVTAILLPLVGRAVDSLGAPLVLKIGIGLSGVSLGLMVFVDSPLQVALVYGVLFAMGSAATSITPIGVLLTRRFPDRVGFANSIAISGMGVGQLLIVAGLASQLEWFGWRGAFLALALINLLLLFPLVVVVTREFGLAGENLSQQPNNAPSAPSVSVSSVWRSRYWWWLLYEQKPLLQLQSARRHGDT